ncbi:MAG: hypothetical protein J6Y78_01600 [Paludibacteraceae bacterium]|nr:hypothetical protein [Paludibacteraceae bacterium]
MNSCFRVNENIELLFDMDCYRVVVCIKKDHSHYFEDKSNYDSIEIDDLSEIEPSFIEKISIQYGVALLYDENRESTESLQPFNYIMNVLLNLVNAKFKDSITCSNVESYCFDDSCTMCDDLFEYGFIIKVYEDYWLNVDFFHYLDDVIKKLSDIKIPAYYSEQVPLSDNYEINILPSNTKTRRLGYLKLILWMFEERSKQPAISIYTNFEKYVQPFSNYLLKHKDTKGLVKETKTGNSAKPYMELAESLGLIHKTVTNYELGKMGKVYLSIKRIHEDNPFLLDDCDKSFFLEQVLKNDYLYMYIIMELICKERIPSYKVLKQGFQENLLNHLFKLLNQDCKVDSTKILRLKVIEQRIKAWDKPMTYLEHILMPRINWLYDLGLIEYEDNNNFGFTASGKKCFLNLSVWNDLEMRLIVNPINYINKYYIKVVDNMYAYNAKPYSSELEDVLIGYLNDCFEKFKTVAPNRTTFSLAANYCKYMFCFKRNIMLDIEEIKEMLTTKLNKSYIYKYQAQYKDGYIQKR